MKTIDIDVKHVTRVEGHGNIVVNVKKGEITRLELQIVESPRFFESFLRGRHYREAPHITCRICGICSVGHTTASVKAMENAMGITPSEQTLLLRKLMLHAEQMQSHWLHVFFLAVPDFLGVGSVIPLANTHPEVVKRALRMKRLANDICCAIAGRHIHPIAMHVGGFTHIPKVEELVDLKRRLEECRADLGEMANLMASFEKPDFNRDTEYIALSDPNKKEYAFYDGKIASTKTDKTLDVDDYLTWIIEHVEPHSTSKHVKTPRSASFMVGALARYNLNHELLHPAAKDVAVKLGLNGGSTNSFDNNTAQIVETVHCVEDSIEVIDELLTRGMKLEPLVEPTRFGRGAGTAEVPRGILFHDYTVGEDGYITDSNLIIPTTQNMANIEADLRALVKQLLETDLSKEEITLKLEMLVRAYDPCISCSVHFLNVKFE
ncbi:MAG: Ni/Fe hydrogenase subunit alpha [Phycisphaerae bacterium]|nr:Ni/Fe hydrogenase subunit alpha [Phycisphaerae bacterium]